MVGMELAPITGQNDSGPQEHRQLIDFPLVAPLHVESSHAQVAVPLTPLQSFARDSRTEQDVPHQQAKPLAGLRGAATLCRGSPGGPTDSSRRGGKAKINACLTQVSRSTAESGREVAAPGSRT